MGADARRISLRDCGFDTTQRLGLAIPGCSRRLPDAALVRTIPEGSFEAVTRRLGILHALRDLGVLIWNDARAIERCVDKSTTSFHLALAGIPTPDTWTVESPDEAAAIVGRETMRGSLVYKPLFGSQGRGLRLIHAKADLPSPEESRQVYYLQRFVGEDRGGYHDYRVFVVAGEAIAAMSRNHSGWITNVKQGGKPRAAVLDRTLRELAERAAAAVGADYCGVDIVRPPSGGLMALEVNSMPAWSGLQKVANLDIAQTIAKSLLQAIAARAARRLAG